MAAGIMAASAAANVAGGLIGSAMAGKDRRAARDAQSRAIGAIANVKVPTKEELLITLQKLELQGQLTPELEQEILQNPSKLVEINQNQQMQDIQKEYLNELRQLGRTGLTPEERAAMNQERMRQISDVNARDQAILQNIQARGGNVSAGNEMAQRLLSSQQASQNAQSAGDNLMAQAFRRALEAKRGASDTARQIDETDYNRQFNLARAQDEIARFNTLQRTGTQERNVGTKQRVQEKNLGEKQRIADSNVGLMNEQEQYNKAVPLKIFDMDFTKARAIANAELGVADANLAEGQRKAAMFSGIGSSIGKGISGFGAK